MGLSLFGWLWHSKEESDPLFVFSCAEDEVCSALSALTLFISEFNKQYIFYISIIYFSGT